jgi:hypothetical protein
VGILNVQDWGQNTGRLFVSAVQSGQVRSRHSILERHTDWLMMAESRAERDPINSLIRLKYWAGGLAGEEGGGRTDDIDRNRQSKARSMRNGMQTAETRAHKVRYLPARAAEAAVEDEGRKTDDSPALSRACRGETTLDSPSRWLRENVQGPQLEAPIPSRANGQRLFLGWWSRYSRARLLTIVKFDLMWPG